MSVEVHLVGAAMPFGLRFVSFGEVLHLPAALDGIVALSYLAVLLGLVYLVLRQRPQPRRSLLLLLALFLIISGCSQWIAGHEDPGFARSIRLLTAALSVASAVAICIQSSRPCKVTEAPAAGIRGSERTSSPGRPHFLAGIGHEIRTPLTSISGFCEYLLDQDMSGPHKEILRLINESTNNLRHILDDVLDLSRLEAGKLRLVEHPFALGEMLDAAIASLIPRAAEKGVSLHLTAAPDLPHVISADQARVTQILTNLIRHAISLSPGGSVVVSVRALQRSALRLQLLISVECSTFESSLEKVHVSVEPNRAQATTSGVGLALSGGLAQLMSGQMHIESEEGGRCSMSVQLWVNT